MPDVTCGGGCWGSRAGDHAELNPEKATNVKSTHRADQIWCQVHLPTSVLPNRFRVPQLRCDNSTAKPVTRPNNSDHSTPQSITDGAIAWKEPRQTTAGKYCDHRETEQHLVHPKHFEKRGTPKSVSCNVENSEKRRPLIKPDPIY